MTQFHVIGKSVPRVDAGEKVTGSTRFCADLKLPGMLYGKLLRSPHPHARLLRIDTSKAESLPGVKAVVTGEYAPTEGYRFYINERSVLAREVVRFKGEPVAAVAAVTPEIAEEAIALVKVDYEALPAVFDPEEALRSDPPAVVHPKITTYAMATLIGDQYKINPELPNVFIHRKIRHGDIERGFGEADLIIENRFSAPRIHHGVLESQNVLARLEAGGGFTAWVTANRLHPWRMVLGRLFGIPPTQIRLVSPLIGGSFGARNHPEVMVAQTLLLAFKSGRPVKLVLSREECFLESLSRESIVIYIKDGVKKDGTLVAREMKLVVNGGAYNTATVPCTHNMPYTATGIYRLPHFKLDAYGVVTNEPPITAFSGYGTLQISYAIEAQMDLIAERLGLDAVEIRRKNILNEGDEDPCGQTVDSIGVRGCLDKVANAIQWEKTVPLERGPWRRGKGIGLSTKHSAAGAPSVALVKVHGDATIEVRHGAHEQGAGCNTTMAQIAAEAFGTSLGKIK
ncbi:MAG: coxL, partial [Dehalococcoidia bacterium]|nr:coxL [Dehalococcoidia bacterium]